MNAASSSHISAHAAVADLHHVGADLHRVAAQQDELGRVAPRFDAADARQRSARETRRGSAWAISMHIRSAIGITALHE